MTDDKLDSVPEYKIYKPWAIQLATFLGGPLVAGYLIAENFKLLGEPEKVRLTWIHTTLASGVIFAAIFILPNVEKVPSYMFPVIYSLVASYLVQRYQGEKIKAHIQNNGQFYSIWRAILVSIIGVVITVAILVVIILLTNKDLLQKMGG